MWDDEQIVAFRTPTVRRGQSADRTSSVGEPSTDGENEIVVDVDEHPAFNKVRTDRSRASLELGPRLVSPNPSTRNLSMSSMRANDGTGPPPGTSARHLMAGIAEGLDRDDGNRASNSGKWRPWRSNMRPPEKRPTERLSTTKQLSSESASSSDRDRDRPGQGGMGITHTPSLKMMSLGSTGSNLTYVKRTTMDSSTGYSQGFTTMPSGNTFSTGPTFSHMQSTATPTMSNSNYFASDGGLSSMRSQSLTADALRGLSIPDHIDQPPVKKMQSFLEAEERRSSLEAASMAGGTGGSLPSDPNSSHGVMTGSRSSWSSSEIEESTSSGSLEEGGLLSL
mmetsp:Transcript_12132/g.28327  ORF Transcript_12132/g.28327 Transcript_12132/m.28327 type:complete len:337 (+) Transcript_12132:138-1148(+)|eukprot:CAMPEP_0178438478 /NCGR_PEP_ID=MMETSP0689_2-20121128/35613_1 /TAXON_ID=160604 /ORGANISM="Amphidinium massartii, Strain CS-259" /LENGTH=336 /DNA_ID=CAMNT_0020060881 /DNA_START=69 /DNA_END=1079 /DNA_ORIENTATION=+